MTNFKTSRFRVQAGAIVFEVEGTESFIQRQMEQHQDHIGMILDAQAKLIQSGEIPTEVQGIPRGRKKSVPKAKTAGTIGTGRRPGRQPVIVRDSQLELKPRQLSRMKNTITALAKGTLLGKDASVFIIAYHLCTNVLNNDTFTAGDVINVYNQLGAHPMLPKAQSVDVVQMLRNLAATSIGKEWVARNEDGTFSLTGKGKAVAATGDIVRRRGRRPTAQVKKAAARRGRPPKKAATETEAPAPKKRGPKPGAKKVAARRGRPPKKAAAKKAVAGKKPGRKAGARKKA